MLPVAITLLTAPPHQFSLKKLKISLRKKIVCISPSAKPHMGDLSGWSSLQGPFGSLSLLPSHPWCSAQLLLWAAKTWQREPRGVVLSAPRTHCFPGPQRGAAKADEPQLVTSGPGHPQPQVASPWRGAPGQEQMPDSELCHNAMALNELNQL